MSSVFTITRDDDGRRLDRTLRSMFKTVTLGSIMSAIRRGEIRINGSKVRDVSRRLSEGDELSVNWEINQKHEIPKNTGWGKIRVIYQSESVLILNKPSGMLVQPDTKNGDSVISRVWGVMGNKNASAVHRLDRNTTGVLAVALHGDSLRAMEELFKSRKVRKFYMAVTVGKMPDEITIDAPLLKDSENNLVKVSPDGLKAVTHCKRLSYNGEYSLVMLELLTGRTHQARVHAAYSKHPILGDRKYGDFDSNRKEKNAARPFLHAYKLQFPDNLHESLSCVEGKSFIAELPDDMKNFIDERGLNYEA